MKAPKIRLSTFVCALVVFAGCAKQEAGKEASGSTQQEVTLQEPSDAEIKTHALAFNAILDARNEYLHSKLIPYRDLSKSFNETVTAKETLSGSWGINSREELLAMLEGIRTGEDGHRGDYWSIREKFLHTRIEEYGSLLYRGPVDTNRAFVVAVHLGAPVGKALPITAWDFGRYINLSRFGFVTGWLGGKETWDLIMPVARMLQASYGSWDEFAADYLLGRTFWDPARAQKENEEIRYTIKMLERPDGGLWASIPWNQSLGAGPVMEDPMAAAVLKDYKPLNGNMPDPGYMPPEGVKAWALRTSQDAK